MSELARKRCIPCSGGTPPLAGDQIQKLRQETPEWDVIDNHHLSRDFRFADFVKALAFVNKVGELAESEAHHPDIHLGYGKARIDIWTHKIDGLSESDFILAAKIDNI